MSAEDHPSSDAGRPLLYLDVDGTLLRRRSDVAGLRDAYVVDPDALSFLTWAVERFECRWLSTRCREGNAGGALRAFRHALGVATLPVEWARVLDMIPAAAWSASKIEGIALEHPAGWWWVDDAPTTADAAALAKLDYVERLILVASTQAKPLKRVMETLGASIRDLG